MRADILLKIIHALCIGSPNSDKCLDEYLMCISGEIELQVLLDCVQLNIEEQKCEWLLK